METFRFDIVMRKMIAFFVSLVLICGTLGLSGCYSSSYKSSSSKSSASSSTSSQSSRSGSAHDSSSSEDPSSGVPSRYYDPRWPTEDMELATIPEQYRYYKAYEHVGEYHTVVGPVVDVYQATQSDGMPIFVDIGKEYPSTDCFTFLIWAEDLDDDLERMLNSVDHGGAWLQVTGYVSLYNGRLQIQSSDGPFEYHWWTNVD